MRGGLERCGRWRGAEMQSGHSVGEPVGLEMRSGALFPALGRIVDVIFRGAGPGGPRAFLQGDQIRCAGQRMPYIIAHQAVQQTGKQGMFDPGRIGSRHFRNSGLLRGRLGIRAQNRQCGAQLRSRGHRYLPAFPAVPSVGYAEAERVWMRQPS